MKTSPSIPHNPENVINIKNMVCHRCILMVSERLTGLGLHPLSVELGVAIVAEPVTDDVRRTVHEALHPLGFELIEDKRSLLVEQIKSTVIEWVRAQDGPRKTNLSDCLSGKLHREYSALSKLFSETTGTTIEKYFIAQKIERAKELLVYDELSLNQIADLLGYSSASYLSAQFKSVTGLTPGHFKQIRENKRKALDKI